MNKIGLLQSGSQICQSWVWLKTELDDKKSFYQLIITVTIFILELAASTVRLKVYRMINEK